MITVNLGQSAPLQLELADGATNKYPQAEVRRVDGFYVGLYDLVHQGNGNYISSFMPPTIGYYTAVFIVYDDALHIQPSFYEHRSDLYEVPDLSPIAGAVWEEALVSHDTLGTFGKAINDLYSNITLANISDSVWDAFVADHQIADTFGDWIRATHQWSMDAANLLSDVNVGLLALKNTTINEGNLTTTEVLTNRTILNNVFPAIIASQNNVNANVDTAKSKIDNLSNQLTAAEAAIIAEVNVNENKLDTITSTVSSISNNTTTRFIVPDRLIRPSSGTKSYQFEFRLFDTNNNPEAPDSTPTIRIRRLDTGIDIVLNDPMTQDGAKVGAYYYNYTITSSTPLAPWLVEVTVVEATLSRYVPALTEVTDFESDLTAVSAQIEVLTDQTTDIQNKLNNGVSGLDALKTESDQIRGDISYTDSLIMAVKSKTDLIPAVPASQGDVAMATNAALSRPDIIAIQNALNTLRIQLMGPDTRNMTQIYDNQPDLSNIAKTSDPRFAFLDAPISSRSTLTAAQVWSFVTRTLTSETISNTDVQLIWNYLTSGATTPGTMGYRIATFLDAAVSSRATYSQVQALLSGVAQEVTTEGIYDRIDTLDAELEILLAALQTIVNAIKVKTDNLPTSPASEVNATSNTATIQAALSAISTVIATIKAKTDPLPASVASAGQVAAIPVNPLLDNDARLTNLDAKISTRARPSDLTGFSTPTDVTNSKNAILSEIANVESLILDLPDTAALVSPLSTTAQLLSVQSTIIAALPPPAPTAATIWTYPTRILTAAGTLAEKSDLIPLAKTSDLANIPLVHQYLNRMSTVFNTSGAFHELIAWAEKDGQVILGSTDCEVDVKDSFGASVWSRTLSIPNADGIFRFQNAIVAQSDRNYYVVITITVDGTPRSSTGSYITVG